VDIGINCSLRQLLEHGFFHADPHPGNLLATPDGRLAFLDFGMMSETPPTARCVPLPLRTDSRRVVGERHTFGQPSYPSAVVSHASTGLLLLAPTRCWLNGVLVELKRRAELPKLT